MQKLLTLEEFTISVNKVAGEIIDHYKTYETDEMKFMGDGIINVEQYYHASPKILWILKEPYDEDGGGWSISDLFNKGGQELVQAPYRLHKSRTWLPVIYSSYAIINGMIPWDYISYPDKEPEVIDALKNIAIMNILKIPGESKTPYSKLEAGYNLHRNILKKQIETYNPDIIIGGNTLNLLKNDYLLDEGKFDYNYEHDFWLKDGRVFIDCKHPSTTLLNDERIEIYVDGITEIVKVWAADNNISLQKKDA